MKWLHDNELVFATWEDLLENRENRVFSVAVGCVLVGGLESEAAATATFLWSLTLAAALKQPEVQIQIEYYQKISSCLVFGLEQVRESFQFHSFPI